MQLPGKRARLDGVLEEQAGVGGERQRGQVLGRPWRGGLLAGVALGDQLGQAAPELGLYRLLAPILIRILKRHSEDDLANVKRLLEASVAANDQEINRA